MLTCPLPYVGANRMEVAYSTVNSPIPSAVGLNANLPDELDQLLSRVLAKDPNQRPQTVRELLGLMAKLPQRRPSAGATVPPAPATASAAVVAASVRSEEHTSELQSRENLVCRLLLEKK